VAIVWACRSSVEAYASTGKEVEVPRPRCPACQAWMVFWSGYWRNGEDGTPLPFDGSRGPYALRHGYAQRHADAGVPVDVLRDLMDHVSIEATSGYYTVSFKRKQEAIRSVGSLAVDASGNPAPFSDAVAYERASVSVPFGNCTEPSNVKAGGGHCPIRFQCAGCGFYRPDPSFLPALEAHIARLRADKETAMAMGAAEYVVANMSAEIDAFARVAEKMRQRLVELDPTSEPRSSRPARSCAESEPAATSHSSRPRRRTPDEQPGSPSGAHGGGEKREQETASTSVKGLLPRSRHWNVPDRRSPSLRW
jgi:hypothetical protein